MSLKYTKEKKRRGKMIAKNKRKCLHEYSDELIRECEGFLKCKNGR